MLKSNGPAHASPDGGGEALALQPGAGRTTHRLGLRRHRASRRSWRASGPQGRLVRGRPGESQHATALATTTGFSKGTPRAIRRGKGTRVTSDTAPRAPSRGATRDAPNPVAAPGGRPRQGRPGETRVRRLWGAGHAGTPCLALTHVPDAPKESRGAA